MRVTATLGRSMLASIFIVGGLDAVRDPGHRTAAAEKLGVPSPEIAVRANGAAMLAGGVAMGLGIMPRRSAVLLAGSLIPTTYAGHAFWEETDPAAKASHQIHFFKNLAMLGGLLLVAGDAPHKGTPRSARKAGKAVAKAAAEAARESEKAEIKASRKADKKTEKRLAKADAAVAAAESKKQQQLEANQLAEQARSAAKQSRRTSKSAAKPGRLASVGLLAGKASAGGAKVGHLVKS